MGLWYGLPKHARSRYPLCSRVCEIHSAFIDNLLVYSIGLIGNDGEFYFHPQKPAKIVGADNIIGKKLFIPILPYNNFLLPGSNEQLNIFEMRHRQLLNEVAQNGGVFGLVYLSQAFQRISLVGTLCRVKSRRVTDDGRVSAVIEGIDRFYLEEVVSEKPFIKGLVRTFKDHTEAPDMLDQLELQIFTEVQTNLKVSLLRHHLILAR
jgi:hypothetical protein